MLDDNAKSGIRGVYLIPFIFLLLVFFLSTSCKSIPAGPDADYLEIFDETWQWAWPQSFIHANPAADNRVWGVVSTLMMDRLDSSMGVLIQSLIQDRAITQRIHRMYLVSGQEVDAPSLGYQILLLGDFPRALLGGQLASQGWKEIHEDIPGYPRARVFRLAPEPRRESESGSRSEVRSGSRFGSVEQAPLELTILENGVLLLESPGGLYRRAMDPDLSSKGSPSDPLHPVGPVSSPGGSISRLMFNATGLRIAGGAGGITRVNSTSSSSQGFTGGHEPVFSIALYLPSNNPGGIQLQQPGEPGQQSQIGEPGEQNLRGEPGQPGQQNQTNQPGPELVGVQLYQMSPELQSSSSQVENYEHETDRSPGPESLPWQMEFILQPGLQESNQVIKSPHDETFMAWVKSRSTTMKLLLSRLARKELLALTSQELRNRLILTRLPPDQGVSTTGLFIHGLQAYPADLGNIVKELEHDWRN